MRLWTTLHRNRSSYAGGGIRYVPFGFLSYLLTKNYPLLFLDGDYIWFDLRYDFQYGTDSSSYEDANDNKKELGLVVSRLIKTPIQFTDLILGLFTNGYNQVFTEFGLTNKI